MSNPAGDPASNPASDARSDAGGMPLVARTERIDDPGPLLDLVPRDNAFAWIHGADGIVGWGRAASFCPDGTDRFAEASGWWADVCAASVVRDDVDLPGSGLVAFASVAFDPRTRDPLGHSRLVIPEVVFGRRGDTAWVTVIGTSLSVLPEARPSAPASPAQSVEFADGAVGPQEWTQLVTRAVERIQRGELEKVVMARDMVARLPGPLDVRWPLRRLAAQYPECWTFHVDGLFGATPEMLVRLERGLVTSRVLAGTIRRSGDDTHDLALAASLARSSKDREEHEYAVRSVADKLAPYCSGINVPESPFVLHLANLMHLATDVTAVIADRATALDLAGALHPSAAVGGTPTDAAMSVIRELEGMDRGRYAGPVGWIGASGDGEFGIALRSAQCAGDGLSARMFAGCGIVADSLPDSELAESNAKLSPVRSALTPVSTT